jgi:uncharacterized membrane protein
MEWGALLLVLHLLSAVIWVGGMFFALLVLRPSLAVLEPQHRLALHRQVFRRFFLVVWHVMSLLLLTGFAMLFGVYGGFGGVGWNVHVMFLLGLIMAAVFVAIVFGPWRQMRASHDTQTAAGAADAIRRLITVNLVLGLLTVVVAALNPGRP